MNNFDRSFITYFNTTYVNYLFYLTLLMSKNILVARNMSMVWLQVFVAACVSTDAVVKQSVSHSLNNQK